MNDEKCCGNCMPTRFKQCEECSSESNWQRNPEMWLDILPDKAGWYWVRMKGYEKAMKIIEIILLNGVLCNYTGRPIADYTAREYQGPMSPKGERWK